MEEAIYKILTDESARGAENVAQSLETQTTKAAPWYNWMSPADAASSTQS